MKKESKSGKSAILLSALMGSAVGAGVMLLLAPKSGRETRDDLKRFADNARDQVAEVIDEGRELYREGREIVDKAAKAGRETYAVGAAELERLMHKKDRSLVMPVLAGGVIGAGLALLLAPKSGKETRSDLKRIAGNTREKVVSAYDKGKVLYLAGRKDKPKAVEAVKNTNGHEKKKLRHAS